MKKRITRVRKNRMFISVEALRLMGGKWLGEGRGRLMVPRWQYSYRVRRPIARPSDRKRLNEGWARFKVWSDQKEKERRQGKEGVDGVEN
jgi:hypothetical protein